MLISPRARFFVRFKPRFGTPAFRFWLSGLLAIGRFVLSRQNASEDDYKRRRGTCAGCPIYNRHFQSCGTPGNRYFDPKDGVDKEIGCYCFMPIKAATDCNCWAYELTSGQAGWPESLNTWKIKK